MPHGVEQRDIRAVFQRDSHVSDARGFNLRGSQTMSLRPVAFSVNHMIHTIGWESRRVIPERTLNQCYRISLIALLICAVTDRLKDLQPMGRVEHANAAVKRYWYQ